MSIVVAACRGQFLGATDKFISAPIPCQGNVVAVLIFVSNVNGTPTGTFAVDGSYDAVSWSNNIASQTHNVFGPPASPMTKTDLDFAYIRIRAENSAASTAMLFDATAVFSEA